MSLSGLLVILSLIAAAVCAGLAFTSWGRSRPLHRYGALSVAAHLLLLAGLASVRVGGPPNPGADEAPPVRVKIVMRTTAEPDPEAKPDHAEGQAEPTPAETETSIEKVAATPPQVETESTAPEPTAPEPAADSEPIAEVEQAKPVDSPETCPSPVPAEPIPEPVQESIAALADPEPTELPLPKEESFAAPPVGEPLPEPIAQVPIDPVERTVDAEPEPLFTNAATSLAPSTYQQRGEIAQRRLSADEGGTQETLDAVASAVDWLARAQRRDGGWDAAAWGAGRETRTLNQDRKSAGRRSETGLTGLALLALGGAGHTHTAGPYRDSVRAGLQYLLDQQLDNGGLYGNATLYARTYCHSMATFALAEAMAVTRDDQLRPAVEAAVGYLVRGQSGATGGWRYQPGDRGDMSQMGWAVMALRSAELAGVKIPETTWQRCEQFVASVRRGQHGGLACYQPRGPTSNTMTAEAMYCRQILGTTRRGDRADEEAVTQLLTDLPGSRSTASSPRGKPNLYYWYYATLALHHHGAANRVGSSAWQTWNEAMQRALLPKQVAAGPNTGSWNADTVWGGYGGRVYSTALAAMCLEVDYRYDAETIGRDPWIAARPGVLRR